MKAIIFYKKLKKYFQDDIAIKKVMIENSNQEVILINLSKLEIWEKFKSPRFQSVFLSTG